MNLDLAEKIVTLLGEYPVSEIVVETAGCRVHAVRPSRSLAPASIPEASVSAANASAEVSAAEEIAQGLKDVQDRENARVLTAPMVGIFYHADPPLLFSSEVKAGQVIGSIESMKLMNDVAAEEGGRVVDILVEDGAPVDYGRALFRLASV